MKDHRLVPIAWVGVLTVAATWLALGSDETYTVSDRFGVVILPILLAILALIISIQDPGNRLVWLLNIVGLSVLVISYAEELFRGTPPTDPDGVDYIEIALGNMASLAIFFSLFLILHLFPNGRTLGPNWKWPLWVAAIGYPLVTGLAIFADPVGPNFGEWTVSNPIGFIPRSIAEAGLLVWSLAGLVVAVGGVFAIVVRYRRSEQLVRLQIKWVIFASALTVFCFFFLMLGVGDGVFAGPAMSLIPFSITIAITRYRLYEIDRLISRTLTYSLVVFMMGAVFLVITWLPSVLIAGAAETGTTSAPPILVAGSTLAAAALFNPMRKRVQRLVDRKFNRSGYRVDLVTEQFAEEMRRISDLGAITDKWLATVDRALEPTSTSIWLRDPK